MQSFKRGQIWWVRPTNSVSNYDSASLGRPAVIVSSDFYNQRLSNVTVSFITSQDKTKFRNYARIVYEENGAKKIRFASCTGVASVSTTQLERYIGECDADSILSINNTLVCTLSLPQPQISAKQEDAQQDDVTQKIASMQVELDLKNAMYQELLRRYVEISLPKKQETSVQEDTGGEYKEEAQIVPTVDVSPKPVVPEIRADIGDCLLDINKATYKEIMATTGMCEATAVAITGYRKRNGRFHSVEDLRAIPRYGVSTSQKYDRFFYVTPVEEEDQAEEADEQIEYREEPVSLAKPEAKKKPKKERAAKKAEHSLTKKDGWHTLQEVADVLGTSTRVLKKQIGDGNIYAYKKGNQLMVKDADLKQMMVHRHIKEAT